MWHLALFFVRLIVYIQSLAGKKPVFAHKTIHPLLTKPSIPLAGFGDSILHLMKFTFVGRIFEMILETSLSFVARTDFNSGNASLTVRNFS